VKEVSVLIPNYNNDKWLTDCINSCIQQLDYVKEIIVVDDGSNDQSIQILNGFEKRFPREFKWFKNPGKGANNARNCAFAKSTGRFIQWLDSDDELLPGKFRTQIPCLSSGEADIVYSDWEIRYWHNGFNTKTETKKYGPYDDFLLELIKDNWTAPNNYLMTSLFAQKLTNGIGWNPKTKVGQDREYFTMAGILGARFEYIEGVFAIYNKQQTNTISSLPFRKRLELNQKLEDRIRRQINVQEWITRKKKNLYISIVDTHKLKACFYHSGIIIEKPISLFSIKWNLMHWKMRLIMPWILVRVYYRYLKGIIFQN
jgi:glycosyltransferase involved in cell wall biosynthesis